MHHFSAGELGQVVVDEWSQHRASHQEHIKAPSKSTVNHWIRASDRLYLQHCHASTSIMWFLVSNSCFSVQARKSGPSLVQQGTAGVLLGCAGQGIATNLGAPVLNLHIVCHKHTANGDGAGMQKQPLDPA